MEILGGLNDSLYEEVVKDGLNNRIIIINQDINDSLVEDVIFRIIRWNMDDIGLPKNKRKKITLLINSCGGDAYTAFNLIDVIENSTTPIDGIALGLVASAAYYIFIACHNRYAFKNSILLQHDGSITVSNSNRKAQDTMKFFDRMEERTKEFVLNRSTMTEEFYDDHYEQEFYFYPDKGIELGVVDKIIGEGIAFDKVFCE